ncbi:MAG: MFS transporter [Planctomycetaceae bacterium]|nr:MFS transporter [Planctomycetaceae bacterium]
MTWTPPSTAADLSASARHLILAVAFLGWAGSGLQMAVMTLAGRAATTDFLRSGNLTANLPLDPGRLLQLQATGTSPGEDYDEENSLKRIAANWNAWYQAGFLLGAAAGGLVFGWLGDRLGRVRAMALSITCYSAFSGVGYLAVTPEQLLVLRFLSGMGVGGMWPTGVSLASEAWPDVSRPMLAGLLGTSANVGLVLFNTIGYFQPVVPDSWRWTQLICATPIVLGLFVWAQVPESQRWLAARNAQGGQEGLSVLGVFQPPLLQLTLIGIALGTIPLLGGWGATQWLVFWADKAHGLADPRAKALTAIMRSSGGAIGSLMGGWLANLLGRRVTYFIISLASLAMGQYICLALTPKDYAFSAFVFALGFISTVFFGWLPLYLPELFPTHARATGSGVSFNFGRIITAAGVLAAGAITTWLNEDYGRAGSITMLVYALGMIVILFAPDTTKSKVGG